MTETIDRIRIRDNILRVLRAKPWLAPRVVAPMVEADEAAVKLELAELERDGVLEKCRGRWALRGTKREPAKTHAAHPLTEGATRLLSIVTQDPWKPASAYANAKGGARFASYSMLETLVKHGLLQLTVHEGVKCWGPPNATPPIGHMVMQANSRSPRRQGLRERATALLRLTPWVTVTRIATELRARPKAMDTCIRQMHDLNILQRAIVDTGDYNVYAYALRDAPPFTGEDEARVLAEAIARRPSHYGRTLNRVTHYLDLHPWVSASAIAKGLNVGVGSVNSALARLSEDDKVIRVPDDSHYVYALPGTTAKPKASGRLLRGTKGKPRARDLAISILAESPGKTADEIRLLLQERTGRNYTGLHGLLTKAQELGFVASEPGKRGRSRVNEWFLVEKPTRSPVDVRGELEARAAELRSLGFEVSVNIAEAHA